MNELTYTVKLYFKVPVDRTKVAERIPTGTPLSVSPGSVNTPPSNMLTLILFHCPVFLYMRIMSAITTDNNKPFGLAYRDHTDLQSSKTLDRRTARQKPHHARDFFPRPHYTCGINTQPICAVFL